MNLQGRNLQQGLTGADVSLLHTELALLNLPVPANEKAAALFGPGTLAAVQLFQKENMLGQVTGKSPLKATDSPNEMRYQLTSSNHGVRECGSIRSRTNFFSVMKVRSE